DGGAHDADTMAAPVDYFAGPLAPPAQRLFVVPIELRDFSFLAETRALALLGRQELQADVISRVRSHLERPMKVVVVVVRLQRHIGEHEEPRVTSNGDERPGGG